ncbi:hypothetical protein SMD22_00685 (plasmid) [Brevibacillus halotolerans]|nr:hypothetical protein SMD22_00685 [Brevibacillus halotolerans]
MKRTGKFCIDGKKQELPLFEQGDRVKTKETSTSAINATGTVESTSKSGLLVYVNWDNQTYPSEFEGDIKLGKVWMVDKLELICPST